MESHMQQKLLDLDVSAMSGDSPREYLTSCSLFGMAFSQMMGMKEENLRDLTGMWAINFDDKAIGSLGFGTLDMPLFALMPSDGKACPFTLILYDRKTTYVRVKLMISRSTTVDMTRELSLSTDSEESFSFATERFKDCLQNHEKCKGWSESGWLPSRLICLDDVEEHQIVRLVLSKGITPEPYVSLSHCWGSTQCLSLTKSIFDTFRHSIQMSKLPKTFTDSFHVSLKLETRYIWIDSLCIIQDDSGDWFNEASQIDKVYTNSLRNICATGFEDSSHSLFVSRDPTLFRTCDVDIPWLDGGGSYRILDKWLWMRQVPEAPLNKRAWVVQEHLLAPRHLHFGANQIFWECVELSAAEQYPNGLPLAVVNPVWSSCMDLRLSASGSGVLDRAHIFNTRWMPAVAAYMDAKLTFPQDKAIAFAGIVKKFETLLGDECIAGLWKNNIECHLLWYTHYSRQADGTPSVRPDKYRAPSFS